MDDAAKQIEPEMKKTVDITIYDLPFDVWKERQYIFDSLNVPYNVTVNVEKSDQCLMAMI